MVQDQLVDYISSQLKLTVSRDAIKTALTGAGWAAQDVEDSFKKVDGVSAAPAVSASPSFQKPVISATSPASPVQPQMIKMSDLVSGPKADAMKPAAVRPDAFGSFVASSSAMKTKPTEVKPVSSGPTGPSSFKASKPKSAVIAESLEAVIIVALAIFAGYLYFNSQSLLSEIGSLKAASGNDSTSAANLTSQVNALTASTTALGSQVASLTAGTQELATELSLYAVAPGASISSTSSTFTGTLSLAGAKYWITMQYGAKAVIANSGNTTFAAQLKPNVGKTVQISGTSVPGSDQVIMTALLSPAPVVAAAPAATSTAPASTTSATSSTTTP